MQPLKVPDRRPAGMLGGSGAAPAQRGGASALASLPTQPLQCDASVPTASPPRPVGHEHVLRRLEPGPGRRAEVLQNPCKQDKVLTIPKNKKFADPSSDISGPDPPVAAHLTEAGP